MSTLLHSAELSLDKEKFSLNKATDRFVELVRLPNL